eukprot:6203347-Pleurochrysis_carterae.AAC.3
MYERARSRARGDDRARMHLHTVDARANMHDLCSDMHFSMSIDSRRHETGACARARICPHPRPHPGAEPRVPRPAPPRSRSQNRDRQNSKRTDKTDGQIDRQTEKERERELEG